MTKGKSSASLKYYRLLFLNDLQEKLLPTSVLALDPCESALADFDDERRTDGEIDLG